jgi:hypothetical protein
LVEWELVEGLVDSVNLVAVAHLMMQCLKKDLEWNWALVEEFM